MIRSFAVLLQIVFLLFTVLGCSVSDYPGHRGRNTKGEALIEYVTPSMTFYGFGEEMDGTYMYTTRYKNRHWENPSYAFSNKIVTYRNEVLYSKASTQGISVDGGSIKGARGYSGGTFKSFWVAYDKDSSEYGGFSNLDQEAPLDPNENWIGPMVVLGFAESVPEVDNKDVNLQSTIKTAGNLLKHLYFSQMGASDLSVGINAVILKETKISLQPAFPVNVKRFGMKIENIGINGSHPSFKTLVRNILKSTQHLEPVRLELELEGGLAFPIKGVTFSFNHDRLKKWLAQSK